MVAKKKEGKPYGNENESVPWNSCIVFARAGAASRLRYCDEYCTTALNSYRTVHAWRRDAKTTNDGMKTTKTTEARSKNNEYEEEVTLVEDSIPHSKE